MPSKGKIENEPIRQDQVDAVVAAVMAGDVPVGNSADNGENKNPWFRMFGAPHFEAPARGVTIYKNKDGSKSALVASVIVPFAAVTGINAGIRGNIYMRRRSPKAQPVAEYTYAGSRGQGGCIKTLDEAATAADTEFRKWVANQYGPWRDANPQAAAVATQRAASVPVTDAGMDWTTPDEEDE